MLRDLRRISDWTLQMCPQGKDVISYSSAPKGQPLQRLLLIIKCPRGPVL